MNNEIKENVTNVKGENNMYYENEGIFKYIINEDAGVVVCVFDNGWKRAISKLCNTIDTMTKKCIWSTWNASQNKMRTMEYNTTWYNALLDDYEKEKGLFTQYTSASAVIIKTLRKKYTKNFKAIPALRGIAKCNKEIDTFDKEAGKKLAKLRLLVKYNKLEIATVKNFVVELEYALKECKEDIGSAIAIARHSEQHALNDTYGIEEVF